MQAIPSTQLRLKVMQLAQTQCHVVEGTAQFGQFVMPGNVHPLVVIPGGDRAHAFRKCSQRPRQVLGHLPANGQREHRTQQENQHKQVGLVHQSNQIGVAQQTAVDHALQLARVINDRPVQAAITVRELLTGQLGIAQFLLDCIGYCGLSIFKTLAGEYFSEAFWGMQIKTQVQRVHLCHADQKTAVDVGRHQ